MVSMSTFVESDHPRRVTGKFEQKRNDAPTGALEQTTEPEWLPAGGGCTCLVNPNPHTYYGAVEPGDALDPDPDCPVHFPQGEQAWPDDTDADYADWVARNEQWAADACAGRITEPDTDAGSADAWTSTATPF